VTSCCKPSPQLFLDGILYFFIAFEGSATQKFLQCWEQVKITWGQYWIMQDAQKLLSQNLEALLAFW